MRYVIMLQIVSIITLILLGASAMFAWLQNRSFQPPPELEGTSSPGAIALDRLG